MTNPGVTHTGRVIQVNPTAESHEEHGNMVRIRVQPDDQAHLERDRAHRSRRMCIAAGRRGCGPSCTRRGNGWRRVRLILAESHVGCMKCT